jgi:putative ABC transport system permease protein
MRLRAWVQTLLPFKTVVAKLNFGNGGHRKIYPAISYDQAERFAKLYKLPARISIDLSVTGTAIAKYASIKTNPNIQVKGTNENYLSMPAVT